MSCVNDHDEFIAQQVTQVASVDSTTVPDGGVDVEFVKLLVESAA